MAIELSHKQSPDSSDWPSYPSTPRHQEISVVKYDDNTTIINHIINNNESSYWEEINNQPTGLGLSLCDFAFFIKLYILNITDCHHCCQLLEAILTDPSKLSHKDCGTRLNGTGDTMLLSSFSDLATVIKGGGTSDRLMCLWI